MPFLDEILGVLPNSIEELKTQCIRHGVEDYPQVESLLSDTKLSSGLHRDWRKAVFRLLDNIFARFKLPTKHTYDRLDAKIFPFTSYYCPALLSRVLAGLSSDAGDEARLRRDRATTILEEIQREISGRGVWSRIEVLTRCLSVYADLEGMCLKIGPLLDGTQSTMWNDFAKCLRIADHYDMSRKVYQSLDQEDVWNDIMRLSLEDRGEVLNLWQSTIDDRAGEYGKLKRALFKIVKETCTLPNSMILRGIELESREAVHGGGCADIYKGAFGDMLTALKVLRIFNREDLKAVIRELCKEAIVWRQLKHENVAPFLGLCNDLFPNRVALVAPWMENGDLSSYLSRNPDADRVSFAVQIALGMKYLHSQDPQIIHGDLRANNVLVDDEHKARITDFGISKVNVVQTKLSVQSNRGSARWQAPELHYNEEGLSHVTTKSDVYAYGMTCFEIFTDTIPFAHLSSDGMVIMEIIQKKSKPRRPSDPIFQKRGLTDRLWALLEDCWTFEAQDRLSMVEVTAIVQNESRFIVKERERLESVIASANLSEVVSGEQRVFKAEGQDVSDNEEKPVPHNPIRVPLDFRLDESSQKQTRTVSPPQSSSNPSIQVNKESNDAEFLDQFIPRGRPHPALLQENEEIKSNSGRRSRVTPERERQSSDMLANPYSDVSLPSSENIPYSSMRPRAPKINLASSESSIMTRSSATTMASKSSEQTDTTTFTSPDSSPVQEKKDSLNSILSLDDDGGALTNSVTSTGWASDGASQHILVEPPLAQPQLGRSRKRVSFGTAKPKPSSFDADAVIPNYTYTQVTEDFRVDSPKSSLKRLSEPPEVDVQITDRSEAQASLRAPVPSDFAWSPKLAPLIPRVTESPPSFDVGRVDPSSPRTHGAELQFQLFQDPTHRHSLEQIAEHDPRINQVSKASYAQLNAGRQLLQASPGAVNPSTASKLRNRMGAIKVTNAAHDEDPIQRQPRNANQQQGMVLEPKEELEVDPWGLNDPPSPIDYEHDELDHLQAEDEEEKEALMKYTVLASDEQRKKHASNIESSINDDVRDFFEERDIDKAQTYFILVPAEHRYKLMAQLAMFAIKSEGEINALLAAELFDKSAENDWCSASDYEKAARTIVEELNKDPSIDVSVASKRLDILLEGMELTEAFKSLLRQLYCGEFLSLSRSTGTSPPAVAKNSRQSTSSAAHKFKID